MCYTNFFLIRMLFYGELIAARAKSAVPLIAEIITEVLVALFVVDHGFAPIAGDLVGAVAVAFIDIEIVVATVSLAYVADIVVFFILAKLDHIARTFGTVTDVIAVCIGTSQKNFSAAPIAHVIAVCIGAKKSVVIPAIVAHVIAVTVNANLSRTACNVAKAILVLIQVRFVGGVSATAPLIV